MKSRRRRRGFTLIELLVVISIIGILVGLLLPAVNQAREAGRRTQCASNMRNCGLAILQYVNTKNSFPAAGTFGENVSSLNTSNPSSSVISSYISGTAANPLYAPMYSWVVPILPYLDQADMYNQWSMYSTTSNGPVTVSYLDGMTGGAGTGQTVANLTIGQASNFKIGSTAIGVLRCPDYITAQPNQGNLSYAVNGGFNLWHAPSIPIGWAASQIDGASTTGPLFIGWGGTSNTTPALTWGICQKLGVFFLESVLPQGLETNIRIPWNIRSTLNGMVDGASSTIMMSENTLTGASTGTPYSASLETNWASPMPNFSMFIGSSWVCSGGSAVASGSTLNCMVGQNMLQPTGDYDGPGWAFANKVGTYSNINYGQNLTLEGSFPFTNSGHPGGSNMMFCDGGVRFISNTIDGTVYSKLLTPAGSRLPYYCKQLPLSQDAFVSQ